MEPSVRGYADGPGRIVPRLNPPLFQVSEAACLDMAFGGHWSYPELFIKNTKNTPLPFVLKSTSGMCIFMCKAQIFVSLLFNISKPLLKITT
jgi:hypothetical protein